MTAGATARAVTDRSSLSRRERRRREVRTRIVEAAVRLFDAKGFAATTVAEICDAADVAEKTFFNHFVSKQDMLREVARVELAILLDLIAEARRRPGASPARIEAFFRLLVDRIDTAGPMRRELLTELVHVSHESGAGSRQAHTLHVAFATLLRETGRPGARVARVDTLADVVLGAFYALMFSWANLPGYPLRKRATAVARFLGDAVAGPKRRRR
jgi:AcrR family transcriptional regulator